MAEVTLRGNTVHTIGALPAVGSTAPTFSLTKADLTPLESKDLVGKRVVLNIFPSVDTGVCAASVRAFNARAGEAKNTVVLCVSADLPFALGRFCGAEGITNVTTASEFRNREFGDTYGVRLTDGPMRGLLSRSVVVLDEASKVLYTELVGELTTEPNYDAALAALK